MRLLKRRRLSVNSKTSRSVTCLDCGFFGTHIADITDPKVRLLLQNLPLEIQMDWATAIGRIEEVTLIGRNVIRQTKSPSEQPQNAQIFTNLDCARNIWLSKVAPRTFSPQEIYDLVMASNKCSRFFPYCPGFTPSQHLDLLREDGNRKFLWKVGIIAAITGAAFGTLGTLLAYHLTS